ncbi:hypothetical protein Bca52824_073862 [Brassica carinata]|uniref:Uncharacterized protein n=1 Tax=Brassica carinata TaxID=52824 RepID=A0A8X7QBE1_BRACI|nr:hypothetical protein Bca52824_073862 [Brassica carinata]
MNDLMTKSFLSYVELKKQAKIDTESDHVDVEKGDLHQENLSAFFSEIESIKTIIEEITHLYTISRT